MTRPFNPNELPPEQLRRLVEILTHFGRINTVPERQTFLQLSGLQSLEPHLHISESTHQFAAELIREAQKAGSIRGESEPAFYQLLGYLQKEVEGHAEALTFVEGLHHSATPPVTRADTLQRPSLDFTGRTAEIERLTKAIRQGRPVMISGMGGIGKTDLARKVAELLHNDFPSPALQVELQPDNKPLTSTELVRTLILAFHPTIKLPDTLAERITILRPLMQGQKGILLLDNAATHEQIQVLETLWHGWAVLITSRVRWVMQGGRLEHLEPMEPNDAEVLVATLTEMYERTLTAIEIKKVAEVCQYHPLALHIASAYLGTFTHNRVENYLEQVRTNPITALIAPEYTNLAQILGISIEHLYQAEPTVCERWHLLALMPDAFDIEIASELLGQLVESSPYVKALDEITTQETLNILVRLNLLEPMLPNQPNEIQYYQLHNFFADYALHHSPYRPNQTRHNEAIRCHALIVLWIGGKAQNLYMKGDPIKALSDFDALWIHLSTAWQRLYLEKDFVSLIFTNYFSHWLAYLLSLRLSLHDLIPYYKTALNSAEILGYVSDKGIHTGHLANIYLHIGEPQTALKYYDEVLSIAEQLNDQAMEATTISNIGHVYASFGEFQVAIDYYCKAYDIYHSIKDQHGEGHIFSSLGNAYHHLGQQEIAIIYIKKSLKIARYLKDRHGEGQLLASLGAVYDVLRRFQTALKYFKQKLSIDLELKDKHGEASTYNSLGLLHINKQQYQTALNYCHKALDLYISIGDRYGEANSLGNISIALSNTGEIKRAIECRMQAISIHHQIGAKFDEAKGYWNLALMERGINKIRSIRHGRVALELMETIKHPYEEKFRAKLREWDVEDVDGR
jgi:tetratricopeptide (TPR) repeat protein